MLIEIFIGFGCAILIIFSIFILILSISFLTYSSNVSERLNHDRISILIPFRNEMDIRDQLHFLKPQLSLSPIRTLWVDDFSESVSEDFLKDVYAQENFELIRRKNGKPGKKEAIVFGLKYLKSEWVLLMDADTRPDLSFFHSGGLPIRDHWRMVLIPILPIRHESLVRKFFDLEFIALQFVTHAAVSISRPLLANGAAMLIRRADYLETLKARSDFHLKSGDDIFSLFAFQSQYGNRSIGSAFKRIQPFKVFFPTTLKLLFMQRVRWIGKTGMVPNCWFLSISILVLIANFSFCALLASWIFIDGSELPIYLAVAIYLFIAAAFLLVSVNYWKRTDLVPYIIPAILVYPFYLSALLIASAITKPKWK